MLWARVGVVSAGVGGRADREMGGSGPAEGGSHSSPGQTHSPSTTMTVILSPPILSPLPPSLSLLPTWSLARPFPRLIVPWDRHFTCPPISSTRITKWIMTPRRRLQPIVPSSWERGKDFPVLVQAEEKGPTRCTRSVSKKESARSKSWFLSLHFYAAWFGPGHYTCIFQTTMSSGIAPPLVHNRLWNLSREDLPSAGRPDSQPTRPVTPQVQNTII